MMRVAMGSASEGVGNIVVEAVHDGCPVVSDEAHRARLARLEAPRGTGGDVEAEAPRLVAVEAQRRVGLEEMIMRAHLDRPGAGIGDLNIHCLAARIQFPVARRPADFAWDHWPCSSADRLGGRDPLWA